MAALGIAGFDFLSGLEEIARGLIFRQKIILIFVHLKYLAQQARRYRRERIDTKERLVGRANHLIGHAEQPFVAAAAEGEAKHRLLVNPIVQPIERNKGSAYPHLVARIVDGAFNCPAAAWPREDAVADRELPVPPNKFRPKSRKVDAALRC